LEKSRCHRRAENWIGNSLFFTRNLSPLAKLKSSSAFSVMVRATFESKQCDLSAVERVFPLLFSSGRLRSYSFLFNRTCGLFLRKRN